MIVVVVVVVVVSSSPMAGSYYHHPPFSRFIMNGRIDYVSVPLGFHNNLWSFPPNTDWQTIADEYLAFARTKYLGGKKDDTDLKDLRITNDECKRNWNDRWIAVTVKKCKDGHTLETIRAR